MFLNTLGLSSIYQRDTSMTNKIELLAPGGDVDSIKAAIVAGADAVYCGLDKFNARNRAKNISFDELLGVLRLAHENDCEVFITLNIIIVETEIPALIALLNRLVNTAVDGIIVQDFGLLYLLGGYFPSLKVHASTQLTTHNAGQVKFLKELFVTRVNLCRELNINEIRQLTSVSHAHDMLTEVFVHGSNCISFSGLCYISSVHGGNSGNRGRCSQSCRNPFDLTAAGKSYPLNLKDNSAFLNLNELVDAGVDSLKIEGRIKKFDYVYTVVNSWRKHIDKHRLFDDGGTNPTANDPTLKKVFNRDLSNGFLTGEIHKDLFIDNPRDNSAINLATRLGELSISNIDHARAEINTFRAKVMTEIEDKISRLSIEQIPLTLRFSGLLGEPLKVVVETIGFSAEFLSQSRLRKVMSKGLEDDLLYAKLKAINETGYFIAHLNSAQLEMDLTIPFKELVVIRQQILLKLNGSRKMISPVELPKLESGFTNKSPSLSVLISSVDDLCLGTETTTDTYFMLPDAIGARLEEFIHLFSQNKKLIPCFPAVLIGDDYTSALALLNRVNPSVCLTNNSGIAFEAWRQEINWIAGPEFNTVNSYTLHCLKENFNCVGAFLSNELSMNQLKQIKKPDHFKLFYSIYHPIVLMTSRQCLFHQVSGCHKHKVDQHCIADCDKTDSISNAKNGSLLIEKSKGNYNRIYNELNFLNTDIVNDIPNKFESLFINLQQINTPTKMTDKVSIVHAFKKLVTGEPASAGDLQKVLSPTTHAQYQKGI